MARPVPDRRETLDEIARRDHFDARCANELDRAPVDARDVWDRTVGEYSMATRRRPCSSRRSPASSWSRPAVPLGGARKMGERAPLDGMDQPAGLAGCGNQVIPAARGQMSALAIDRRSSRRRLDSARESRTGASRRRRRRASAACTAATSSVAPRRPPERHLGAVFPADIPNKYSLPAPAAKS